MDTAFVTEGDEPAPDFVLGTHTHADVFQYDIAGSPDYQSVFALHNNPMQDDEKLASGTNLFSPVLTNQQRIIYGQQSGNIVVDPDAQRDVHFTLGEMNDPQRT